ncbi:MULTISPECIES: discoidin domain-containing protein [Bacillus cereus group]|nr:discoidin domain-containing protein [Bacillus mycoides]MCQ6360290.1 discoidin domain-containing protein [Bacillus cereus]CAH2464498.1 Peptidase M60 [Bacillus mycoides KBAB4]
MFQRPIKVLATSAILATTLVTPIITNSLTVQAETVAVQTENQYEQREFELPGTGSYQDEAKREKRGEQKNYVPTGIYVKPNEQVTIEVSGTKQIRAIIGTHQYDKEWGKEIDLSPGSNTISSPNGGLLGFDNHQDTGTVKVKVTQGGSPIPFFELGKHTKKDWISMMDKYPDAHAVQLKSEKAVLTITRDSAKKYMVDQDPIPLLKKYDEMIKAEDKISGLSETDPNPLHRPTRRIWAFVEDPNAQDWGMCASLDGAVFTTAGEAIESALNVNEFGWGQFHEAGHARQQYPWTWNDLRGMGEVTVNLYSLAAQKRLFPDEPTRLEKEGDYDRAFTYLKQTDKEYKNIDDLFVKLVMIWQLQLAYGENFYPNLHKIYRDLPEAQLPKTDEEKIQAFIYNTSKVAKQNLLPFFDQWGLKASEETRQKIEALNNPTLVAPIWEATDSKPVKPLAVLSKKTMKVSANSEESSDELASNAIDGNPDTIWHSQWSEQNQYPYNLMLEMDETRNITQVAYLPRQNGSDNGHILNYNIYTSVDGLTYEKVSSGTWENNSDKKTATFAPVTAKYVKVEVTDGKNGYASAAEIDILTDSTSVTPYVTPYALPNKIMKASANSEESSANPASNAIDGDSDTIWHSQWSETNQYPYNLTLEMDETRNITQVAYLPRQDGSDNGHILNYNIYTSVDGLTYEKVSSGTWENNSDKKTATFDPVSAKYVKLEVLNGVNGFSSAAKVDILTDSTFVTPHVLPKTTIGTESQEEVKTGWQSIDGVTYYYENGKPATGFKTIDGVNYYFSTTGDLSKNIWENVFILNSNGSISLYGYDLILKEETTFEVFMNGKRISTLGTFQEGTNMNDRVWGILATSITHGQAWNPQNKFEIKANGNTIATLDNPTLVALSKKTMKVSANSEESSQVENLASHAIDGNPDTLWHSKWSETNQYPYSLTLEMDEMQTITQVAYLPRQDSEENGRILQYNIYTSVDGLTYEKVSSGTWENNSDKKTATFAPVSAKYVKLEVLNGVNGFASAAEVDVLTDSRFVTP